MIFESKVNPENPKINRQTHLNPESRHKSNQTT